MAQHPPPAPPSARQALVRLLRDAARLDRTQSDPVVAFRNAVGVAAPLAIGILAGRTSLGLAATVGALQAAFADRPGPYRLRMLRMLGTALAAGLTSGLAVFASQHTAASVALLLVLAFVAGLLLTGGPSATQVGIAGTAAALVLGHLPQPPDTALRVGLLVLAGGALQTLLAVAAWPLGRHRPERLALAGLYGELAAAARAQRGSVAGPPAADRLTSVRQTLYGLGHDHGPSVEAYRVLLDEAERIRREIVVLTGIAERLAADHEPILAGLVRGSLTAAASVLDEIADALAQPRTVRPEVLDAARQTIQHAVDRLADDEQPGGQSGSGSLARPAATARLHALAGQLRAAVDSTRAGASEGRRLEEPDSTGAARLLRDPVAILRANLSPSSAVLRHAVRLAVLVAGSDLALRLADVYRGYWVPLTLLVVLRPDFATTLQRAVLRTAGTIVGLLVTTALVHWVPGGQWWQVALIAVLAFGMRLAGPGNIGLSAVCLSGLVVVLLELNGVPAHTTVEDRALATLVGGAVAVLATLAAPAWERQFVATRLADLLHAYRGYLDAVAQLSTDRASLHRARAAGRLARSNAQVSVDRARSEPVRGQNEVELGRMVLAHTHRFVHAVLAVEAVRLTVRDAGGSPELARFLGLAGQALDLAEQALRTGAAPVHTPPLRPEQEQLAAALLNAPDAVGGQETAAILIEATDRITNSLDTLLAALRTALLATPSATVAGS